jgi:hypothetical protein
VFHIKYINVSLHSFRRLIVGFSTRGHWFDPEPVYVKCCGGHRVTATGFSTRGSFFSANIILLFLRTQLSSRIINKKKQIWQISDIVVFFCLWRSVGNKSTFTLFGLTKFNLKNNGLKKNAVILSYPGYLTSNIEFPFDRQKIYYICSFLYSNSLQSLQPSYVIDIVPSPSQFSNHLNLIRSL